MLQYICISNGDKSKYIYKLLLKNTMLKKIKRYMNKYYIIKYYIYL